MLVHALPPQYCPLPLQICTPSNMWFLGSTRLSIPSGIPIQPFLHSSWHKVPIFCNGHPFPPKLPLPTHIWTPIYHMIHWAHASPQPKWHLDRFSHSCTVHRRVSLYFTMGCPFPSKLSISMAGTRAHLMGDLDPHLIHGSLHA